MPPCSVTNSALGVQAPLRRKGPSPAELTASVRPRAQTLRVPVSTTEQEEVQVQVTRVLVESYFDIVRKNLQDAVPKARPAPPFACPSKDSRRRSSSPIPALLLQSLVLRSAAIICKLYCLPISRWRMSTGSRCLRSARLTAVRCGAQAIMHFLVNTVTRGLQQHLIRDLYREEHFDQLVREREDVAARRQECTAGLAALRGALTALERLPANLMSRVRAAAPTRALKSVGALARLDVLIAFQMCRMCGTSRRSPKKMLGHQRCILPSNIRRSVDISVHRPCSSFSRTHTTTHAGWHSRSIWRVGARVSSQQGSGQTAAAEYGIHSAIQQRRRSAALAGSPHGDDGLCQCQHTR